MCVATTLPASLFKVPSLLATINVAETPGEPPEINIQAAETALRAVFGVDVDMVVRSQG